MTKDAINTDAALDRDAALLHEGTLKRNIGVLGIIGIGLSIVNGWVAMSSTIVIGLGSGGTAVILFGVIGTSFINAFVILTIAEMASAYPTAGGQYVWSAIMSGALHDRDVVEGSGHKVRRHPWAFVVGWLTVFEWIVIVAAVSIIASQAVFGLVTTFHPDFVVQRWQVFLIFELVNTNALVANIFYVNKLPNLGTFFLILSNVMFIALVVTIPATAATHQSSKFVWTGWENETGWTSKFVVVATGLVNPAFIWSGIDGAVHIAEEVMHAGRTVPIALFSSIGLGFVTGFAISIALAYSVQDFAAAATAELPFLTIIVQATRSNAAGAVFMTVFLLVISIMTNSIQMASSRIIWSFARDKALPFSRHLSHVHPTLRVPILPIVFSWAGVTILGLLYIASTTIYNSIISSCIILQNCAISIVAAQLMMNGRRMNPNRWFNMRGFGWIANTLTILWTIFTSVMWLFPAMPKPAAADMNYTIAVLGVMGLIAALDWFLYARKHFRGPSKATLDAIEAEVHMEDMGETHFTRGSSDEKAAAGAEGQHIDHH